MISSASLRREASPVGNAERDDFACEILNSCVIIIYGGLGIIALLIFEKRDEGYCDIHV